MPQPRVLILRAPGTNCDQETAFAFEQAGAKTEWMHINRLLESPTLAGQFQILCLPGGFSYGDDVAAGRILATQIQHHLAEQLARFKADGKLILGICNGFQVLVKSGILLEADAQQNPAGTLCWNDSGKFEDRWVRLRTNSSKCVFLQGIETMYLPVAHAEGKFVARDAAAFSQLEAAGQLVLCYQPLTGEGAKDLLRAAVPYPDNPNGSMGNVAGVCDQTGRVFGLMPHPERHIDPTQHPRWTRGEGRPVGDGMQVFVNAVRYFA
jgi:phosphoribosylformylglycinamidine synthase